MYVRDLYRAEQILQLMQIYRRAPDFQYLFLIEDLTPFQPQLQPITLDNQNRFGTFVYIREGCEIFARDLYMFVPMHGGRPWDCLQLLDHPGMKSVYLT